MPISIVGDGSITGLSAGGLPDASVVDLDLATGISSSKLTGALPALDGSSLTGVGVTGITSASSSGTAINIASDNDVGVRGAPDANTTLQVNSGSGEKGLHLKQTGNSGGAFAKFVRVSSGDTSNGHWELHHESKHLTFKTNASGGSISSPTLTDVFKVCQDGRGLSQFTAKAWVRFNGTGTVSINDSHNVSSLNDSGTGWCYVAYTNSLGNGANSCVVASCSTGANSYDRGIHTAPQSTANFSVMTFITSSGSAIDVEMISAAVFGD